MPPAGEARTTRAEHADRAPSDRPRGDEEACTPLIGWQAPLLDRNGGPYARGPSATPPDDDRPTALRDA